MIIDVDILIPICFLSKLVNSLLSIVLNYYRHSIHPTSIFLNIDHVIIPCLKFHFIVYPMVTIIHLTIYHVARECNVLISLDFFNMRDLYLSDPYFSFN